MIFGYARVSTSDQSPDLQIDALLAEGIDQKNIHTDKISSTPKDRKSLNRLWDVATEGDTIVVWKLDRLARSLIHFTKLMNELEEKGVKFKSIHEPFIDTTKESSNSRFLVNMFTPRRNWNGISLSSAQRLVSSPPGSVVESWGPLKD
ncbi:MAG TPA: recombinase family protein [Pricia sp.]|nr:recombinase family protein [Pricia sp.]